MMEKECKHIWKIKEEHIYVKEGFLFNNSKNKVIVLQCKKCGILKNHFVYLGDIA